jgi:non-specific serine/threonine protein kinase
VITGRRVIQGCVDRYVAMGEVSWRSWALWSLSSAEYLNGEFDRARDAGFEVLRLHRQTRDQAVLAFTLTVLAGCAAEHGDPQRSTRLLGAASSIWHIVGASPNHYAAFHAPLLETSARVVKILGEDAAVAGFQEGVAMSVDAAVAYALGEAAAAPAAVESVVLTKREIEVAGLVAQGMTNREIAKKLVISLRTAETHVDHIRTKLGFSNRAQIAAWMAAP